MLKLQPIKYFPCFASTFSTHAAAAAAKSLQSCLTLCDPTDAAHQAPLSLGFSRQKQWSGLPFPSPIFHPRHTPNHLSLMLVLGINFAYINS